MALPQQIIKDLTKGKSTACAIAQRLSVPESVVKAELLDMEITGHVTSAPLLIDGKIENIPTEITVWKFAKPL